MLPSHPGIQPKQHAIHTGYIRVGFLTKLSPVSHHHPPSLIGALLATTKIVESGLLSLRLQSLKIRSTRRSIIRLIFSPPVYLPTLTRIANFRVLDLPPCYLLKLEIIYQIYRAKNLLSIVTLIHNLKRYSTHASDLAKLTFHLSNRWSFNRGS